MMEHTGVWARLALLLAALMLMCSFALAEEASLEILSCVQQGDQVVLNFVCLDEHNAQVARQNELSLKNQAKALDAQKRQREATEELEYRMRHK